MVRELFGWASVALSLAGCGSNATDDSKRVCEPGKTEACACVGEGDSGAQTCDADGNGWSTCECPVENGAAGGAAGSAGGVPAAGSTASGGALNSSGGMFPGSDAPPWGKDDAGRWAPNAGCSFLGEAPTGCENGEHFTNYRGNCGTPCVFTGVKDYFCCPLT